MSRQAKDRFVIVGPDVDVEAEVVRDSRGRRVDQAYIDRAVAEVEDVVARRAGRPSLTGDSAHSPHVSFRVSPEMKARAEKAAADQGITVSQLARQAFERFLA